MHNYRSEWRRAIAAAAATVMMAAAVFVGGGIPSASADVLYQMYPYLASWDSMTLTMPSQQTTPTIPTIISTLNARRFGDRSLYLYRAAATKDIPWYLLAAIDEVELGACDSATAARLAQVKSKLIGSTVDQKLRCYGGSQSFTMMVKRRMSELMRLNYLFDSNHRFPLPLNSGYSYEDTWGTERNYGGDRSHEGIDLIAAKGTPVYSSSYGTVTKKGWLTLGGWRIGVQDENGIYYYYAHLSEYGQYEIGDAVRPGDILGYVGSTGYGPEGTDDVMIPHLHFGMYENDVAFNPYAMLKAWR